MACSDVPMFPYSDVPMFIVTQRFRAICNLLAQIMSLSMIKPDRTMPNMTRSFRTS
jgi:hypothetical protein